MLLSLVFPLGRSKMGFDNGLLLAEKCAGLNGHLSCSETICVSAQTFWRRIEMTEWTEEWPTEPGWYWFVGHLDCWSDKELHSVRVRVSEAARNGVVYVVDGNFMYEDESVGMWCPAIFPEPL